MREALDAIAELARLQVYVAKRVEEDNGCWNWTGYVHKSGYGYAYGFRRTWRANRLVWTLNFGDIPQGKHVLHRCDNRRCVNPSHLFIGTRSDNMRDASAKGRIRSQYIGRETCSKGHPYGPDTYVRANGHRVCRICKRETDKINSRLRRAALAYTGDEPDKEEA